MKKENWRTFFEGKKITMMGLGLLGRGINVAKFLAEHGAILTITDLKTENRLASSLAELKQYKKQITYVLGEHRLEDFRDRDLIIKAAGVPLDTPYIEEAHKNGVPVEMDASLFTKLAPKGVMVVGITGTRGKSTTTHLIYHILEKAGKNAFLGGNVRGLATLPLLEKVKSGDYVVMELDSWQLQGFGEAGISPHVSVFTNLMVDHMNYYKNDMERYLADKANIFLFQNPGNTLVTGAEIGEKIKEKYGEKMKGKLVEIQAADFPPDWKLSLLGEHNRVNAALAIATGRALGIAETDIKEAVESFEAVEGRLEYLGEKNGVKIYNDNNATTADATVVGLTAVASDKNVVLIMGGADKGLDMSHLVTAIGEYCKAVVLLFGTGTEKIKGQVKAIPAIKVEEKERLEECIAAAISLAKKGDVVLFSPALASFSKYFENEYERNDLFVKEVRKWLES
ncbi:MAG: UDP-N-acetylmuramoyl-L-alanine--D-glutamate ligase [Microgenomates group bacterium]